MTFCYIIDISSTIISFRHTTQNFSLTHGTKSSLTSEAFPADQAGGVSDFFGLSESEIWSM